MADIADIIAQYAGAGPTPTLGQQANLAQANVAVDSQTAKASVEQRSAELYGTAVGNQTGAGVNSMTPQERDLRFMTPSQIRAAYGPDASSIIAAQVGAGQDVLGDRGRTRTTGEFLADSALGVGLGAANTVLGIGALGMSAIGGGVQAAQQVQDFNDRVQNLQSDGLQASRRIAAAVTQLNQRDNKQRASTEDPGLMTDLRRVGRDVLDSVSTTVSDPRLLSDGVAQGIGSLVGGAGLIRGAGAIAGRTAESVAPAVIGAMEAGGSYQQSVNQVLQTSFEDLKKNSPMFNELVANGAAPEDARRTVADRTGLLASAITAPAAVAAGRLVSAFEANPLTTGSARQIAGNLGRETLEEGIQSGAGQLAQNVATKAIANKEQDIAEGVGDQIGQGALFGLGSAGAAQGPGAAIRGTIRGAQAGIAATASLADKLVARGERVQAENEAASPVSDTNVAASAQAAVQAAPETTATLKTAIEETKATPERKQEANDYVDGLVGLNVWDDTLVDHPSIPPLVRDAVQGSTTTVEAAQKLADVLNTDELTKDHVTAGILLQEIGRQFDDYQNKNPEAFDSLPEDSPARDVLDKLSNLMVNISNSPKIRSAIEKINAHLATVNVEPVTDESVNTPEGQDNIRTAIAVAETHPDKANLEVNQQILKQAKAGRINLTEGQRAALEASSALLKGAQEYVDRAKALGLKNPKDIVSEEILTEPTKGDEVKQSALKHAERIVAAKRAGNTDLARAYLLDFMKFVQHLQNKVGAINEHLLTGNADPKRSVHYQALTATPERKWVTSRKGLGVNPYSAESVQFAQGVALEAKTLADIGNALATAFPDLNVQHIQPVLLNSLLDGSAKTVQDEFRKGIRKVNAQPNETVVDEQDVQAPVAEVTTPTVTAETTPETNTTKDSTESEKVEQPVTNTRENPEEPVEKVEPAPEVIEEPEATKTGIDAIYPNLIGSEKVKNFFKSAFTIPAKARSRLLGIGNPLSLVREALASTRAHNAFTGSETRYEIDENTAKAYKRYLKYGDEMKTILQQNLKDFLAKNNVGKRFAEGADVNRWVEGKLLNLTEPSDDTFVYNDELLEAAVLAGLQWVISSDQYAARLDQQDIANLTGIDVNALPRELEAQFDGGLGLLEIKQSLADKIAKYWGLNPNRKAPIAYTKGIADSMAAEVIRALLDVGALQEQTIEVTEDMGAAKHKTINWFYPAIIDEAGEFHGSLGIDRDTRIGVAEAKKVAPIQAFPTAIEEAVLVEPEEITYIGGAVPPVAETQLHNPLVENTEEQKQALENEQKTPFYLNPVMANFYSALGLSNILALFGSGDLSGKKLNVNHAKSLDGQNRTHAAAFQSLMGLIAQLDNQAKKEGTTTDQVPVRYAYNMTSVNRMQMLGKYNPQANKLVREAILPTRSTLDLNKKKNLDKFMLGLAQALDVKVHNLSREDAFQKLTDKLNGPLAESVSLVQDWLNNPHDFNEHEMEILRDGLSQAGALSFAGLHALTEWARYAQADKKARKAFTTSVYLEADGVTNGPVNAMMLMSIGQFTVDWVKNMAKGGLFFGSNKKTLNEHRSIDDSKDLYQTSTDHLAQNLKALHDSIKDSPEVLGQFNKLIHLMDMFIPDLNIKDGQLELSRGIAKNPLTITIYGSGPAGIAAKLSDQLVNSIYEGMTRIANRDKDVSMADAMFPNDLNADQKFQQFLDAYNLLTSQVVNMNQGKLTISDGKVVKNKGSRNAEKFTVTAAEKENLSRNLQMLFVNPLREAITQTVGKPLMDAAEILRKTTQIQSIFLQYAFQKEVDAAIEAKKKNDPDWKPNELLSQEELDQVYGKLRHLAPFISTGSQNFFIAGSQSTEVSNSTLGRALNERFRSEAFIYGPMNSGVAGIPFMVIGTGDGQMMQTISTMDHAPVGTLKIFDGMNMKLDTIDEDSEKANEAVYKSWQGNPLEAVRKSYDAFLKAVSYEMSDQMKADLVHAIAGPQQAAKDVTPAQIEAAMQLLGAQLTSAAQEAQARHNAISKVAVSVDQMAAAGAPYQEGKVVLSGSTEEITAALNKLYVEELNKITKAEKTSEKLDPVLEKIGRVHKSGARELSFTALKNLAKMANLPKGQAILLTEILRSMGTKEYKVVYGTPEQLAAYGDAKNKEVIDVAQMESENISGYTMFGDKTIYLATPSSETLIHELIHASTYEIVQAYFDGDQIGEVQEQAVENINRLMSQFLGLGDQLGQVSQQLRDDYADAVAAINGYLQDSTRPAAQNRAAALNEYMAWTLANENLADLQKRNEAHPLVQMAKKVLDYIKQLIWGRKKVPVLPGKDMFSNLLFNTSVLIRSQPTLQTQVADVALFQRSQLGTNDRLSQISEGFNKLVAQHLNAADPVEAKVLNKKYQVALAQTAKIVTSFQAHGFPMNHQENMTFASIVSALATEAAIDPNSMSRAQEMYAYVTKNLKVEDLMKDPNDPVERYYAQEKYDSIMGNYAMEYDNLGRSSLLPTFLALSIVDDGFREVLAKMEVPPQEKSVAISRLDQMLENLGNTAMQTLSDRMSGTSNTRNVQEAIDALTTNIIDVAQQSESALDRYAATSGSAIDRANEYIANGMQYLSDAALDKLDNLEQNTNNRYTKALINAGKVLSVIVNESKADKVARGVMTAMNNLKGWKPFHDLVNDLVGRTTSNANVYDMIKGVRAMVQQYRQQYREHLPSIIADQFSRKLEEHEWTALYKGLGKADIAGLVQNRNTSEVLDLLADSKKLDAEIAKLESDLSSQAGKTWKRVQEKSKQLANYMMTGEHGKNLLRNPLAISSITGGIDDQAFYSKLDDLISLYAFQQLNQGDKDILLSLVQDEKDGTSFALSYLVGQRFDEMAKVSASTQFNYYKGYIPTVQDSSVSLIVAEDTEYAKLIQKSYVRVADYVGDKAERSKVKRGYYYAPVSGRAVYNQGILQNARSTVNGVDEVTGYSMNQIAGRITDPQQVNQITTVLGLNLPNNGENLLPVFNADGEVVAYERPYDPVQLARVSTDTHLAKMIGVWRGRQVEERLAEIFNEGLIDSLYDMYSKDIQESSANKSQYVNLFDRKLAKTDPILADAVKLITQQTRFQINQKFGDEFWVRRDMLNDAIGYRSASIGDAWTGNSRWSKATQDRVRLMALGVMGNEAYRKMVNAERLLQNFVTDARVAIVVKSVVVPVSNFVANIYQLVARGVPLLSIAKQIPKKTAEVNAYIKSRIRQIEAEAELRAAAGDIVAERKLNDEIQSIRDSHRRMSIWPLIEAGEFSSISDAGISRDEILLSEGKLNAYIESLVDKLPKSLQTAGRYALVTKDTALFQGLQKAVEYGDFLAKAVLYDDLTKRQGKTKAQALARITEEFVNYDRLPGRFRGYLESVGLLWFYNFKIRASKVAMSMIRNNPVHTLLAGLAPTPPLLGSVGMPVDDNLFTTLADGRLDYSLGLSQGLRAPLLNPWVNLVH